MVEAAIKKAATKASRSRAPTQAETLRGRIPSLSPAQAEALRYFFAAPERWTLRDGGVLRFATASADGNGEAFELEAESTRLALRLEPGGRAGEGLQWSDYQGRSRLLAWALAHETQLMRLSDALGVSLLPVETDEQREPPVRDPDLWLSFAIESDADAVRGALRLPASWTERLIERADPAYDDARNDLGEWQRLPTPVAIRLPGPRLRAADWRALRRGDVIVIGARARAPAPQAVAADRRWPLAAENGRWRIEGPAILSPASQKDSAMNDQEANADAVDTGAEQNAQHPAHDLPVTLEFELGNVQMSVGDLASIQPGYVFALPAHLEGANVAIRANGRNAGRGEIVAVGDTLGVRLLSWS